MWVWSLNTRKRNKNLWHKLIPHFERIYIYMHHFTAKVSNVHALQTTNNHDTSDLWPALDMKLTSTDHTVISTRQALGTVPYFNHNFCVQLICVMQSWCSINWSTNSEVSCLTEDWETAGFGAHYRCTHYIRAVQCMYTCSNITYEIKLAI